MAASCLGGFPDLATLGPSYRGTEMLRFTLTGMDIYHLKLLAGASPTVAILPQASSFMDKPSAFSQAIPH